MSYFTFCRNPMRFPRHPVTYQVLITSSSHCPLLVSLTLSSVCLSSPPSANSGIQHAAPFTAGLRNRVGVYHIDAKGRKMNSITLVFYLLQPPVHWPPLSSSSPIALVRPSFQDSAHKFQLIHSLSPLTFEYSIPITLYRMSE